MNRDGLQAWLAIQIPEDVQKSQVWQKASKDRKQTTAKINLPSVCPHMWAAPVDPRDVDWFNEEIGQCPFCNAILTNT
jgi:hypothetical protein